MRIGLARMVAYGMAAFAIFVQLAVWGATKLRSDGALLESWQPYFGWLYGLVFAAALAGVCRWLAIARGIVWLMCTWAIGGAVVVAAWWLSGHSFDLSGGVALVSGLGSYVLAAGLAEGTSRPTRLLTADADSGARRRSSARSPAARRRSG